MPRAARHCPGRAPGRRRPHAAQNRAPSAPSEHRSQANTQPSLEPSRRGQPPTAPAEAPSAGATAPATTASAQQSQNRHSRTSTPGHQRRARRPRRRRRRSAPRATNEHPPRSPATAAQEQPAHVARRRVETIGLRDEASTQDRTTHHSVDIDNRGRADLAEHTNPAGTGSGLARDPRLRVEREMGVEHSVRDLIGAARVAGDELG